MNHDSAVRTAPFVRRDEYVLVALAVPLQLLVMYMVPLVYECDAAVYYGYSVANTYRAPLFAVLLWLTGQHYLATFVGTVIVHAAFGVLAPILLYRTLAPITRRGALFAAICYVLSMLPFTAAKLMLSEQLFTTALLAAVYWLSRYGFTGERRFIALSFAAATAAMFTRWEAEVLVLVWAVALLIGAISHGRQHVRTWATCMAVFALTCAGWSAYRAAVLKDVRVFGTLHNGSGDQAFWHVYIYMGPEVYQWERVWNSEVDRLRRTAPPEEAARYRLVQLDNGPATRRLAETIRHIAEKRREDILFSANLVKPAAGGFLTRLGGDPDRLVSEIFNEPNQTYVFSVPFEIRRELGPRAGERLLLQVTAEAVRRHPSFFASKLSVALTMVGISVDVGSFLRDVEVQRHSGTPAEGRFRDLNLPMPFMRLWSDIHYADVPYNMGNCAVVSLPPRMVAEYKWDSELPRSPAFVTLMSAGRNTLRNVLGPLFLLSILFLPLAPARGLMLAVLAVAVLMIGIVAALGGGAYSRYEYGTLPLMLIVTVGAYVGVFRLVFRKQRRVYPNPANT